ncbi:hypothetical protein RI367_000779 [Sorochytrium milnesiophthora]
MPKNATRQHPQSARAASLDRIAQKQALFNNSGYDPCAPAAGLETAAGELDETLLNTSPAGEITKTLDKVAQQTAPTPEKEQRRRSSVLWQASAQSNSALASRPVRRVSLAHPGIPSMGAAGPVLRSVAAQSQARRSSIAIQHGVITVQPLAVKSPNQSGQLPLSLVEERSDEEARRSSESTAAAGVSVKVRLAPSATSINEGQQCGSNLSIDSYSSTTEFPDGYLLGFSDCPEVLEPTEMSVTGSIPEWLSGVFYRCGPGQFGVETELLDETGENRQVEIEHWFDGLSLIHRFEIVKGGKVMYRNRFTSRSQEDAMRKTGTLPLSFAQPQEPPKSIFDMFSMVSVDVPEEFNINVSVTPQYPVAKHGEEKYREILLAKTDANIVQELDHDTLQPAGYFTYTHISPKLKGIMTAAHELYDPRTGEYVNFLQEPGPLVKTRVFSISRNHPHGEILATISSMKASYMHSFSMTQRYIILVCCPYTWKFGGLPVLFTKMVASALSWDGSQPAYFYVIDRSKRAVVATYEADPFFMFHTINAYEEFDDIVIDLCAYQSPLNIQEMYMDKLRAGATDLEQSHIRRYTLSNVSQYAGRGLLARSLSGYPRATFDVRSVPGPELPTINSRWAYKPYRYTYCVVATRRMPFEALGKFDLATRTHVMWHSPDCYPSEAVFVARPGAKAEDDGVVLSIVLDAQSCKSFLLVLDGQTFTEIARASMPENMVVPFGFHGSYMDKATPQ